ncbi:MAG: DUF4011 domain-containing protein [Phycisphaeraceae bacterium]|nr:DUF4011 domain-containing protein [Phycisphaeraceae bacterium]
MSVNIDAIAGRYSGVVMSTPGISSRILSAMLDRLFVAITNGPALNCRPHASRQRFDFANLARLRDLTPNQILAELLSDRATARVKAMVPAPPQRASRAKAAESEGGPPLEEEAQEVQDRRRQHTEQQALLSKLRILVEESRTYQQDTGAHVLYVGYPILSIPGGESAGGRSGGRRVLAPIAFIPVDLVVRTNAGAGIDITCKEDEIDRVIPNESLLAWIERQTGKQPAEFFADENGKDPMREIRSICEYVAGSLDLPLPEFLSTTDTVSYPVVAIRKDDDAESPAILPSAVLGLFPTSKQGLLRDTKAMIDEVPQEGPIGRFLSALPRAGAGDVQFRTEECVRDVLPPEKRRLVTHADPCQARAVSLARQADALVVHGPPGTGKSQTITNIIADHLARGERVLFVCDKRTALDVVANRLEHLGLGSLCAVVHDAQRDQRELYRSVREQIEGLADAQVPQANAYQLVDADAEISKIHEELEQLRKALMEATGDGDDSLHTMIGRWLEATLACSQSSFAMSTLRPELFGNSTLRELDQCTIDLRALLRHAESSSYSGNPWAEFAGLTLQGFLATPMDTIRSRCAAIMAAASASDDLKHVSIPPFMDSVTLSDQQLHRQRLVQMLEAVLADPDPRVRRLWASRDGGAIAAAARTLEEIAAHLRSIKEAVPDRELKLMVGSTPNPAQLATSIAALEEYLATASAWHAPVHFMRRAAARKVLAPLGLSLTPETAGRAKKFLSALRSSLVVRSVLVEFGEVEQAGLPDPATICSQAESHGRVIGALQTARETKCLSPLLELVVRLCNDGADAGTRGRELLEGLGRSSQRAEALNGFENALRGSQLLEATKIDSVVKEFRAGADAAPFVRRLQDHLPTLESVLRIREALKKTPGSMLAAVKELLRQRVETDAAMLVLRQGVLAAEVHRRIEKAPMVGALDPQRIQTLFDRWQELERIKHTLVRDLILSYWLKMQRGRLLVTTGSRLNGDGAELRRRVSSRGTHSLRLRQVLELGRNVKGGDPLLDLRPVWMASPETVAQIFSRESAFDIVVFDEASQCRLEEALPVLLRAKRVVIAGDPKQLPPTRFFEDTSLSASDPDDIETDQDLFENQQSEVEDLLSASLNLDLQQAYLDVHYRSRNADLIEFSNEQFYGSRLQAIPGHPANRTRYAPLTLYNINGVYEKRTNEAEANHVVKVIRDLLRRADPPSIGVGCFNIAQRDLIVEKLEEAAANDAGFGAALANARVRRGHGSFEGLFVKNLENVQGDERDHIIISTTYGPDSTGRFYRRFGPLGMPGGGRRLNVLVTRARCEVHLVTSIPPAVYRALPPIEAGQTPGGGWLLFSYLQYAERLAALYERAHTEQEEKVDSDDGMKTSDPTDATWEDDESPGSSAPLPPVARVREVRSPSNLAEMLGSAFARNNVGCTVHWGNDGFCVDVALDHPTRADDVTVGVLTDFSRFALAQDQIEWDAFSTSVLRGQGWNLRRVWSPMLFRDVQGVMDDIGKAATVEAASARPELD